MATQCLSDMFHRFTQSSALDFCSPHGPSVVRVMWNWKFKDRDSLDFQRIQNQEAEIYTYTKFIPNLYQFNPIHTTLLPTSFSRKTSSPRRENPDTFAFDRFIPPTLLYNTLLHGSLQHVSPKLLYNTIQPFSTPPPTPFYDTLLQQFSTTPFENNLHNALSNQHCHAPLEPFPLTLLYSTLLQHLSTVDILP